MAANRGLLRLVLPATFLIFFLPLLAAWILNIEAPGWLPFGTVNHGQLIEPARLLSSARLRNLEGRPLDPGLLTGRWTLLHVQSGACTSSCEHALTSTRQVRRALGEDLPRVQRLLVQAKASAADLSPLQETHPDLQMAVARGGWLEELPSCDASSSNPGAIFLVDPQGYLILRYPQEVEMGDLHADLERLLKISKIG